MKPETSQERVVTVVLAGETYGIPLACVESIEFWRPLTQLPQMPPYAAGLLSLRGRSIPVLDLAERLGLPSTQGVARRFIVVAHWGRETVGLIVSGVRDVITLDTESIERHIAMLSASSVQSCLRGVAHLPSGFVILLEMSLLLDFEDDEDTFALAA